MSVFGKFFLFLLCFGAIYILSILSCSQSSDDFPEKVIVSNFYTREVRGGKYNNKKEVLYPEVLVLYNNDSFYFSKFEWNNLIGLKIGDTLLASFKFENIDIEPPSLLTSDSIYKKQTSQTISDVNIYDEYSRWFSTDKLYLWGFIFYIAFFITFQGDIQKRFYK